MTRGADGSVLDVGRRRRSVGWRLRKALDARDGGCRFPGCGSRLRTHAHHITHWARGGETALHNLVLLCPFHHRAVHEGGWRVEMDEHGVPQFFNPLGVHMPVVPESPEIGGLLPGGASGEPTAAASADTSAAPLADAAGGSSADTPAAVLADATGAPPADHPPPATPDFGLVRWHGQRGIGSSAGGSLWRGERIDWGWALACLWMEGGDGVGDGASGTP